MGCLEASTGGRTVLWTVRPQLPGCPAVGGDVTATYCKGCCVGKRALTWHCLGVLHAYCVLTEVKGGSWTVPEEGWLLPALSGRGGKQG